MMAEKNPVSVLQEYSQRKRMPPPQYVFMPADVGFRCKVVLEGMDGTGIGRSKREAKFQAAAALLKGMSSEEETKLAADTNGSRTDAVAELRDYCAKHGQPLPSVEIVLLAGTVHCPKFIAMAQVPTVKVYGTAFSKKDAKRKAAADLLKALTEPISDTSAQASSPQNDEEPQKVSLDIVTNFQRKAGA